MGGDNVYYGNTDNDRKEDDIDNDETVINRDGENYCDSDDEDDINNQEKNDGSLYIIQTTTASIVAAPMGALVQETPGRQPQQTGGTPTHHSTVVG